MAGRAPSGDRRRRARGRVRRRAACCARAATRRSTSFERLPTPWGLLRGGVAPDHQEIKRLQDTFDRQTLARGCRFLGNVEVGTDVSHDELMRHYTAVIYATGAQTDKSLGIPGEDLPGSWAATEFVAWYNGHPDYRDLEFDLSCTARRRDRQRQRRGRRRAPADAQRRRARAHRHRRPRARRAARERASRRSSCSAAAAPRRRRSRAPSCASSGTSTASTCDVDADEVELDPVSREWLAEQGTFTARKNVRLLREFAARPRRARRAPRSDRAALPALAGRDPRRRPRRGDRRAPQRDRARRRRHAARARASTSDVETIECGLVLRSVGYRAVPLPDVPFDERSFVLPNERGRVLTPRRRARCPASTPSAGSSAARPGSSARTSATPRRP